jgi:hypothetical protein
MRGIVGEERIGNETDRCPLTALRLISEEGSWVFHSISHRLLRMIQDFNKLSSSGVTMIQMVTVPTWFSSPIVWAPHRLVLLPL